MRVDNSITVQKACQLVSSGDFDAAAQVFENEYPFVPVQGAGRAYAPRKAIRVFIRDGFIDRYRGERLVLPAVLRLLSRYLPQAFPFQRHWKMSACHIAYWQLCATIDHIVPVALGGRDSEENWATCSMLTNSMKANWTLEQLQWQLRPVGRLSEWDGMLSWFRHQVATDRRVLEDAYIRRWNEAAEQILG